MATPPATPDSSDALGRESVRGSVTVWVRSVRILYHAGRVPGMPDRRRPSIRGPASPLRALRTRQPPAMDEGLAVPHHLRLDVWMIVSGRRP